MNVDLNDRDCLILKTALTYAKANIDDVNEAMGLTKYKMGAYEPFKEDEVDVLATKFFGGDNQVKMKESVVHALSEGRAICGLPGIPKEWPEGHQWVDPKRAGGVLTCPTCIMVWKKATKGN